MKLKGRKEQRFVATSTRLVGDPHMETKLELAVPREYIGPGEKFVARSRSPSLDFLADRGSSWEIS